MLEDMEQSAPTVTQVMEDALKTLGFNADLQRILATEWAQLAADQLWISETRVLLSMLIEHDDLRLGDRMHSQWWKVIALLKDVKCFDVPLGARATVSTMLREALTGMDSATAKRRKTLVEVQGTEVVEEEEEMRAAQAAVPALATPAPTATPAHRGATQGKPKGKPRGRGFDIQADSDDDNGSVSEAAQEQDSGSDNGLSTGAGTDLDIDFWNDNQGRNTAPRPTAVEHDEDGSDEDGSEFGPGTLDGFINCAALLLTTDESRLGLWMEKCTKAAAAAGKSSRHHKCSPTSHLLPTTTPPATPTHHPPSLDRCGRATRLDREA